jgi:polysaccharide export outer membrane protein
LPGGRGRDDSRTFLEPGRRLLALRDLRPSGIRALEPVEERGPDDAGAGEGGAADLLEGEVVKPFMKNLLVGMIAAALSFDAAGCGRVKPAFEKDSFRVEEYVIGPEDVLDIQVWKNPDLTKTVTVRPDGKISFPLIGEVEAAGLTPIALRGEMEARLRKFQDAPEVSVIVQQVNSYNVYVLGEVAHPGRFKLKSYVTLLQAISLAGGFTPFASKSGIKVLRRGLIDNQWRLYRDLYDDIASGRDPSKNILLRPGDIVMVP